MVRYKAYEKMLSGERVYFEGEKAAIIYLSQKAAWKAITDFIADMAEGDYDIDDFGIEVV